MSRDDKQHFGKVGAAVVGAVVGAAAVLAGAVALTHKGNQKKVKNAVTKAKELIKGYSQKIQDQAEDHRATIKKVANKAIKSAEGVTKAAKKGVKKI